MRGQLYSVAALKIWPEIGPETRITSAWCLSLAVWLFSQLLKLSLAIMSLTMFFVVAISVSAVSSLETCWVCDSSVSGYSDCLGNSQDTSALLANHPTWTDSCDNGCAKAKYQDNGQIFRGCFVGNDGGKQLCNTPEGVCASDDNSGRRFCLHCCHGNKCNGAGTLTMSLAVAMATILAAIVLKA